jgi:hypothetical protein
LIVVGALLIIGVVIYLVRKAKNSSKKNVEESNGKERLIKEDE